ncbi:MAG: tRNA (adenosine(37)-N6)-threonylcarbamoyltransferase complex dimerization subunit type 1 TsaB [Chloroflexota bacterium]|nr:tRNA (adenosine(37)-N6)-threonylcarbamoyltransferase complex dimerization subunit type 1 TsaB [Chloroflexota bacterium]
MMLLAMDTSTRKIGLALYDGVRVCSERVWSSKRYHTVELAPALAEMLAKAEIEITDLDAIGVATGPGSFTALRIGLALAKGLALSQHIDLMGIPTLDAVAAAQHIRDTKMAAVLEAGRERLAVGWYRVENGKWQSTGELDNLTLDEFADAISEPTFICGELNAKVRRRLERKYKNALLASPAQSLRRPAYLAELAWERWQSGRIDDPAALSPVYLHRGDPIPG